jgi:hypothetical protein
MIAFKSCGPLLDVFNASKFFKFFVSICFWNLALTSPTFSAACATAHIVS